MGELEDIEDDEDKNSESKKPKENGEVVEGAKEAGEKIGEGTTAEWRL